MVWSKVLNVRRLFDVFRVLSKADRQERRKVIALLKLYKKLDDDIRRFQKETALCCERGCGRCCENPNVETTVLELLPLAISLWQNGQAAKWLKKANQAGAEGRCIFYAPDPQRDGKGRCSVYLWRPLICRLFGFSAKSNKNGMPMLVTCPTIKTQYAREYEKARKMIEGGAFVPKMGDYAFEAAQIDPPLGQEQLPINRAVKVALEKAGLFSRLRSQ